MYGGFLATPRRGHIVVVHSNSSSIPLDSVIVGVNGAPIEKYIASFDELFSPTTDNESVRSRRAAAYLAVYNPFLPIASIQLVVPSADKGYIKDVQIKYQTPKRALFSRDLRKTL
jgi:hypothetical protein